MLIKIAISTLVETKNNSKYLITYLDEGIKLLVLILPKITWYIKTFKIKDGDKGKNKKLMSFRIYDDKLLQKHKKYFLTNVELTALPKRDDWYIKDKIRTYVDKVYTNFCGHDVLEDVQNVNLLQPFLLILYWFMKINITCKYI